VLKGQEILQNISKQAWQEWQLLQTHDESMKKQLI